MKLFDLFGIINIHNLPLINSHEAEDNCTVFEFNISGKSIHWKAGQHGIFMLPSKNVEGTKWRAFSISSIPSENKLQIATKISNEPSNFKKALRSLKPGEKIRLFGPYGWLYLQDSVSPVVMIAGGVGITPFRAIFKELEQGSQRDVTLIYSALDTYLFKSELNDIASKNDRIKIVYTHTKEEVTNSLSEVLQIASKDTYYFVSGSPGMVISVTQTLRDAKIQRNKIITDSFRGY